MMLVDEQESAYCYEYSNSVLIFLTLICFKDDILIRLSPLGRPNLIFLVKMTDSKEHGNKIIVWDIKSTRDTFMIKPVHRV